MRKVTAISIYAVGMCSVMDIRIIQTLIEDYKFPIEVFMFKDKYLPCVEVLPKVYHPLSDYVSYVRGVLPDIPLEDLKKFPYTLSSLDVAYRDDLSAYEETGIVEFSLAGIDSFEEYLSTLKRKNRANIKKYYRDLQNNYIVNSDITPIEFNEAEEWYKCKWANNTPDYGIPCYEKWYENSCVFIRTSLRLKLMELIVIRDEVTYEIVSVSAWERYNGTYYGVWFSLNPKYDNRPLGHLTIVAGIQEVLNESISEGLKKVSIGNCTDFPYKRIYIPNNWDNLKAYNYLNER